MDLSALLPGIMNHAQALITGVLTQVVSRLLARFVPGAGAILSLLDEYPLRQADHGWVRQGIDRVSYPVLHLADVDPDRLADKGW